MLRRISSHLSPLLHNSIGSLFPIQASHCLRALELFSTDKGCPVTGGIFCKDKPQLIAFVLGGPGSGKGTQCARIVDTYGFTHLSAGDLLRNEIQSCSKNGAMILEVIKEGKIVPSEVTVKLIQKAISLGENHKFLIDGFPRTEENRLAYERIFVRIPGPIECNVYLIKRNGQLGISNGKAKFLDVIGEFSDIGGHPSLVLFFDCPEEVMVKRVLNRNEGRVDDNEETVKKRLKVFRELSLPVVDYYSKKGILHRINAVGTADEIFEQVRSIFSAYEPMLK